MSLWSGNVKSGSGTGVGHLSLHFFSCVWLSSMSLLVGAVGWSCNGDCIDMEWCGASVSPGAAVMC